MTAGIGSALKRLRMERKLTQKQLAAKVSGGLDYTYIGKIEREEQLPSLNMLVKLSSALAVPLASFFREEDQNIAALLRPGKVLDLGASREMSVLLKELKQLDRRDIPLLVEIVRALNKHGKSRKKDDYSPAVQEYALVAEEGSGYPNNE
ncbi:helix-turn-helix domain-containing protein [Geobacter sp. SVR]|uniref:helix-turn-helix domain-containing protein n=1 Tax=Geobacter sp. SVR TaxID=2495594 RepID=UPI00143EF4B6|nr:helix-turn-helix transcriptional regulator [Geobacter sp. SVR]BCS52060.1 transcriptional regulator [Geobacter sp. SVR]GCF86515.1 transcriptional regulator [Geobacter sp. SVR]